MAPDEVAAVGADWVADALVAVGRPRPTLMPALGTSALGVYEELARRRSQGTFDADRLRLVQLDEYLGVGADDPRSLIGWLGRAVAAPLGIEPERIVRLAGDAPDPEAACRAYDAAVAAVGGIDAAVLGLGPDGHLGFNEPPSAADAPTRRIALHPDSLASNARYWPGLEVPREALTAGMPTILGARRSLLVVTGHGKRDILRRLLLEPVGADLPASFLRTIEGAVLLADLDAWPDDVGRPA